MYYKKNTILPIILEAVDISMFTSLMKEELYFYNSIVSAMQPLFTRNMSKFKSITPDMINLFGSMCKCGTNFDLIDVTNLPDVLKCYKQTAIDVSNDYEIKTIFNSASNQGRLIPDIRKGVGKEILKDFVEKASNYKSNRPIKIPEQRDLIIKRHIQIPKDSVIATYDKERNISTVITKYNSNKMFIKDKDFSKFNNYKMMVLRQKPMIVNNKKRLLPQCQWEIELFEDKKSYLIDYKDLVVRF